MSQSVESGANEVCIAQGVAVKSKKIEFHQLILVWFKMVHFEPFFCKFGVEVVVEIMDILVH